MDCVAGLTRVSHRDPCARQPPINHITVSKKRNWLQQSSGRPVPHPEDFTVIEEDHAHPQTHPSSGTGASARPRRSNVKPGQISLQPLRRPDPAEENDADDEGEIWYNPIPEDEEADLSHCIPNIRVGQSEPSPGASGHRATDDEGGCRETPHTSASHSSETSQLHRQMFACKTQEENVNVRATGLSLSPLMLICGSLSVSLTLSYLVSPRLSDGMFDVVVPVVLMSTCHQTGV